MPAAILLRYFDSRRDDGHHEQVRVVGVEADIIHELAAKAKESDDEDERLSRKLESLAELRAPEDYEHDETDGWDDGDVEDGTGAVIIRCYGRFDRFNAAAD